MYTKINGKGFTERNLRGNINAALALMTSASVATWRMKISIFGTMKFLSIDRVEKQMHGWILKYLP